MKNYRSTLVLLFVLLLLAGAYFLFNRGQSSIEGEDAQFAVKDTSHISQVNLIAYRNSKEVQRVRLERNGKKWKANQFEASSERVAILLKTITRLQVREPVHPNAKVNVIKMLSTDHIRVEIKSGNGDEKVYFVGEEPPIGSGSMMMVNGADEPFIVELPGHNGYLKPFYSANLNDWRENLLFNVPPQELKRLKIEYAGADSSFELIQKDKGFILASGEKMDSLILMQYLSNLGKKSAQSFIDREMPRGLDSLKKNKPNIRLTITNNKNETTKIVLYNRTDNVNTYFGWIEGKNELLLIQRFNMDALLVKRKDLISRK